MKNYVILDCSLSKPHNIYTHDVACLTNGGFIIQNKQVGTIQSLSSLTLWAPWPTDYPLHALRCLFITSFISYYYPLFMVFGFVKESLHQTPFRQQKLQLKRCPSHCAYFHHIISHKHLPPTVFITISMIQPDILILYPWLLTLRKRI